MIADDLFSDPNEDMMDDEFDEDRGFTSASYACEECDYRWDVMSEADSFGEFDDDEVVCPMCGSTHVTQI